VALQRGLVERFPNVSAIDIRELARTVQAVVESVALAISIIGTIALLSGVLILVGSVAMTKMQRLYESALFKTLGAPTSVIAVMIVLEYATLGALAGAVGATAGEGLSWALSRHVLDIPWSPRFALTVAGITASTLLVGTVGVAASLDVLRRKPLGILRAG
jgi:putative ABC transport system permease protein